MADRFDKFTERARRVLTLAQEEAQRFNHNYIGTEHLLLGLLRQPNSRAVRVLSSFGVEPNEVRSATEFIIGRGERPVVGEIGLTSRAKKVIEFAVDEARTLGYSYIGTEHLLLGLMREGEGLAAGALQSAGVDLDAVRREVMRLAGEETSEETSGEVHAPEPQPRVAHMRIMPEAEARGVREAAAGRVRAAQEALATAAAAGSSGRMAVDLLVPQLVRAADLVETQHTQLETFLPALGEASAIHRLLLHGQRAFAEAGEQAAADALREAAAALASAFPVGGSDPAL